jgi:A/G-specific adenine glycosylase
MADAGARHPWEARKSLRFRRLLLGWYRRHRRDLPWRADPSPYRVWVSEVMLQQTQVRTVVPYFERFIARFPTIAALSAAPIEDVMELWSGLGYYSRARSLHRAATLIMTRYSGKVPSELNDLLCLPGIGRYTAGAIRSIAFNHPEPIVDGNVKRVITRLHGIEETIPGSFHWQQAAAWTDPRYPSDFNQAVMELGALVCTPANPLCSSCPVAELCEARAKGIQDVLPRPRGNASGTRLRLVILVLEHGNRVLIVPQSLAFVPGTWGLPSTLLGEEENPERAATKCARAVFGHPVRLLAAGTVRHAITYRSITAFVFKARCATPPDAATGKFLPHAKARSLLTSALFHKALRQAGLTRNHIRSGECG